MRRPGHPPAPRGGVDGAILVFLAAYQLYKCFARKFLDESDTSEMPPGLRNAYTALGTFGYVARAIVFALVGNGLIRAALDYDAKKAVGLDGALHNLANASYGPPLLWLVAIGLFGFAVFSIADARYHRVRARVGS